MKSRMKSRRKSRRQKSRRQKSRRHSKRKSCGPKSCRRSRGGVNNAAEYRAKINQIEAQLDSKFQDLEGRLERREITRKHFTRGVIIANRVMFDKVVKLRNEPSNRAYVDPFHAWSDNMQTRNDRYLNEATLDLDSLDVLVEEGIATEQEAENMRKVMRSKRGRSGPSTNTTRSASVTRSRTPSPPQGRRPYVTSNTATTQRPVLWWYDVYKETDPYLLVPPAPIQAYRN
jgi:hypothetical protein